VRAALDELRAALARSTSTPKTVLGTFTFADIAAAQMLSFVMPPSFGLRIGKHSRKGFTDPVLSKDYADLIAWRDALYEAHRPRG
jgi:glutathione S-transferase